MPVFSTSPRRQPRLPASAAGEVRPAPVVSIADHALSELAAQAKTSLQASGVAIALESDGVIACRARAGDVAPELGTPVQRGQGITGECVAAGMVIGCPDTDSDPRVNAEVCRQLGIRALLLAPLRRNGSVAGVIEAFFPTPRLFDESTVQSLEKFGAAVIARAYQDHGKETAEDRADRDTQVAERPPTVSAESVAQPEAEALPMFTAAQERRSVPYGVMLGVVVACSVLLIGAVALSRYAGSKQTHKAAAAGTDAWVRLRKLADGGDAAAQYYLALAYQRGAGMPRDEAEAVSWLRKSAEQGNADAQYSLGQALENGRGVTADRVEACAWYVVSGMGGNNQGEQAFERLTASLSPAEIGRARRLVGQMHAEGTAVPRSMVSAYRWYALAAAAGDRDAKILMAQLSSQMTPQERAEAKARAAAWMNRHR